MTALSRMFGSKRFNLIALLCLVGSLSISVVHAQGDGSSLPELPAVERPAPLPDLSAYMPEPVVEGLDSTMASATFTVNDLGDAADFDTSDGVCDSDDVTADEQCTLRAAIEQANATTDTDTIKFDVTGIAPFVIAPNTLLPVIARPVIIDGTSQPGFVDVPLISLDGSVGGLDFLLAITASNSTVMGLHLSQATTVNLYLLGSNNSVKGNFIGTDLTGSAGDAIDATGIGITGSANIIGGTTPAARNLISDLVTGILIENATAVGNIIRGNYIGTDLTGNNDLGSNFGIFLFNAQKTVVGGAAPGAGNVISGNSQTLADLTTVGTKYLGNLIGTNAAGEAGPSGTIAFQVIDSVNVTIGGAGAGAGNVVASHNFGIAIQGTDSRNIKIYGNLIGLNSAGNTVIGNDSYGVIVAVTTAPSIHIGGVKPGQGNVISGSDIGVQILNANNVKIRGNKIGTDVTGTTLMGNGDGIFAVNSQNLTIGGPTAGARNIISGSDDSGVNVENVTNLVVQGNYIGTDVTGTLALANDTGITLVSSVNALIGGSDLGAGNLIAGSILAGLQAENSGGGILQQNLIGTNATGTEALPNDTGVALSASPGWQIGGSGIARNIISGNITDGLVVLDQSTNTVIQGNYIGTTKNGLAPLGNGQAGLFIDLGANITIGGSTEGTRNVISANGADGIAAGLFQVSTITGNYIGTDRRGKSVPDMGNGAYGININVGSVNVAIGGTGSRANRIFDNTLAGIRVRTTSFGVSMVGNKLAGNGGLGIDLGANPDGVTPNDPLDVDGVQNFPEITFLKRLGGAANPKTHLKGTLSSAALGTYTVHFYAVTTCDVSGFGEADKVLGLTTVKTDEIGEGKFNVKLPVKLAAGASVVATATDNIGTTSEFSACFDGITPAPVLEIPSEFRD